VLEFSRQKQEDLNFIRLVSTIIRKKNSS